MKNVFSIAKIIFIVPNHHLMFSDEGKEQS
jgi:hypothetical protein